MLTKLKYLSYDPLFEEEQPYELYGYSKDPTIKPGKITNCKFYVQDNVTVEDVRGTEKDFSLENAGFTFIKHQSRCTLTAEHFEAGGKNPDDDVVSSYLQETISLLEDRFHASKVICFDWRFRRSNPPDTALKAAQDVLEARFQARPPGLTMHCDYSHQGGRDRLEMHLTTDELERIDTGRWTAEIINVWRPLKTVRNAPLVMTDCRTVKADDLLEVDKVLPDKIEKAYFIIHRPYHKWYWLSDQAPDEPALFRTWTSTRNGVTADFPPHGAALEFSSEDKEPRESIEVRLIVLKESEQRGGEELSAFSSKVDTGSGDVVAGE